MLEEDTPDHQGDRREIHIRIRRMGPDETSTHHPVRRMP